MVRLGQQWSIKMMFTDNPQLTEKRMQLKSRKSLVTEAAEDFIEVLRCACYSSF